MNPVPKKRLGQHFLRDTGIIERIVRYFDPNPNDFVIEIGAGDGALSTRLAPRVSQLIAFEIDRDCLDSLAKGLEPHPNAVVHHEDILAANIPAVLPSESENRRVRFIGNLPYNIATPIIQKCLLLDFPTTDMLFMVQLEVAERITATPGTHSYGLLSVVCQHLAEVRTAFRISPAAFSPRPKVQSAMVRFRPKPRVRNPDFEVHFIELLKACFAYRRKKILNSLGRSQFIGHRAGELLSAAAIPPNLRAEDIDVAGYERLARLIGKP